MTIEQALSMHLSIVDALPARVVFPRRAKGESDESLIRRIVATSADAAKRSDPGFPVNPAPPRARMVSTFGRPTRIVL